MRCARMRLMKWASCAKLRTMSLATRIEEVEKRAGAIALPMRDLLAEAGVHRATWDRWKAGSNAPNFKTWDGLLEALAKHEQARAA